MIDCVCPYARNSLDPSSAILLELRRLLPHTACVILLQGRICISTVQIVIPVRRTYIAYIISANALVLSMGLEPIRSKHEILSLGCLPVPPREQNQEHKKEVS